MCAWRFVSLSFFILNNYPPKWRWLASNYSPKWRWIDQDIHRAANAARWISWAFTDTEVNNNVSIYPTSESVRNGPFEKTQIIKKTVARAVMITNLTVNIQDIHWLMNQSQCAKNTIHWLGICQRWIFTKPRNSEVNI